VSLHHWVLQNTKQHPPPLIHAGSVYTICVPFFSSAALDLSASDLSASELSASDLSASV